MDPVDAMSGVDPLTNVVPHRIMESFDRDHSASQAWGTQAQRGWGGSTPLAQTAVRPVSGPSKARTESEQGDSMRAFSPSSTSM